MATTRVELFENISVVIADAGTRNPYYHVYYTSGDGETKKEVLVYASPAPIFDSFPKPTISYRRMADEVTRCIKGFVKPEVRPFVWGTVYEKLCAIET